MADYTPPPRSHDSVIDSDLSDVEYRVWHAVRWFQGANEWSWREHQTIADKCKKSPSQFSKVLGRLVEKGWVERGAGIMLRCYMPTIGHVNSFTEVASEERAVASQETEASAEQPFQFPERKERVASQETPVASEESGVSPQETAPYKEEQEHKQELQEQEKEQGRGEASVAPPAREDAPECEALPDPAELGEPFKPFARLESVPVPLGKSEAHLPSHIEEAWKVAGRPGLSDEEFARLSLRSTFGRPSRLNGRPWEPAYTAVVGVVKLLRQG